MSKENNQEQIHVAKVEGVPQDREQRAAIRKHIREYVQREHLTPPLSMEEIEEHTDLLMGEQKVPVEQRDFCMVLMNNEAWRTTVNNIPYERRVLLIPQCLRDEDNCPAEIDEFGLLCEQCGRCPIAELEERAEAMGYFVLVAEGTTVVTKLIEQGKVHGVVGVSCMSVLERAFPHMATHAIPGVAIPLLKDGCRNTEVDIEWLTEAINEHSETTDHFHIDLDQLRDELKGWFEPEEIARHFGAPNSVVETVGQEWLARGGKRWRPILTVAAYKALAADKTTPPDFVRKVALAVECFHKASLIHDDIEDNDDERYGEETLHCEHGVAVALNVGDFLLGEGYRLLAECDASAEMKNRLVQVAAEGHRSLCLGQGEELFCRERREPATRQQVLDIFEHKTAPAFEVALVFGAICAGASEDILKMLKEFSTALGIAYQIRDDILDYVEDHESHHKREWSPSIIEALRLDQAIRKGQSDKPKNLSLEKPDPRETEEVRKSRQLLEHYRNQAIRSLRPLETVYLKSLLHRLTGRILKSV
ncbi:MAG: polyprenyl synthetase family protein [Candidatus Sumerlaeia bacterium]